MITVTLAYPNGQRQEVLLADIPGVGHTIHLKEANQSAPGLIVEHILWVEGSSDVIAVVRPRTDGPAVA